MKLATKVAYNTIIQFISKILATGLGLISIAIITRYLGQNGFGEYTTAMAFLSYFGVLADLGLTLVTVQIISRPGINEERALGNLLALRLVSAIIFLGLAPIAVLFFPYGAAVKWAVAVVTWSFFFTALNQILVGLFQKHLRLDKVSIAEVVSRVILIGGIIAAVLFDYGLMGIVVATVLANAVSFLLHYLFSRGFARIRLIFDWLEWKKIISYSWPLALTIGFNLIYLRTDTLLLSLLKRPSEIGIIAEVGIYGAAYKVIDVLITFPFVFAGIILPILTRVWAEKNREKFYSILQKSIDAMVILAVPTMVGTQLVAGEIMSLVAGPDFAVSGPILKVLIIAAGMIFFGIMFSHAIIAINRQKQIIGAYAFVAFSSVIAYLIVIPVYSYQGAAWITVYSETAIALAAIYLTWKYSKFRPSLIILLKSIIAASIMAGSYLVLEMLAATNLYIVLAVLIPVYFVSLYALKGIRKSDLTDLINRHE